MSPRILFIHGLESRANGSKTVSLRQQGFDVRAYEMHMGVTQLSRRNSVLRSALRLPEVLFVGGSLSMGLLTSWRSSSSRSALGGALIGAGWLYTRRSAIMSQALRKSLEACVEIQRDAITREQPDIVVGSSWGGAVAVELMRAGIWRGPTVLLAPAVHRVAARANTGHGDDVARQLATRSAKTIIFHDPDDDTVPFQDSEALARLGNLELRSVNAGGHRLMELLHSGELAQALRQI
jgi:predicted alpha/beta hydrolase family esterase